MTLQQRYDSIMDYFRKEMPEVASELQFGSTFQLLVAVMLSAQCTDKRVNMVTPALFRAFPDAKTMATVDEAEIFEYVKSVSYPNAKAKHLCGMARMLVEKFDGEVPSDMESLTSLPGVGRKTANVVMAVAFNKAAMAVDTHIYRVSHRLGLVSASDNTPFKVEQKLVRHIAESDIPTAHHWLLLHGRYVCTARNPKCGKCEISQWCKHKSAGA